MPTIKTRELIDEDVRRIENQVDLMVEGRVSVAKEI